MTGLSARVISGGQLHSSKGINLPMSSVQTSALTPKDREDLAAGIAMGVDMVAVSFVQSPQDLIEAREVATACGAPALPLIAKIEKPQAIDCIDGILDVADALMIARGDLGVEIPLEQVPAVQKRIVRAARQRGVPVILATQVLESMRTDPRPTRAEVTDAAHAVDERVDAIMLAGETAAGLHPVRAVAVLDAIIREAEKTQTESVGTVPEGAHWSAHSRALCEAAVAMADSAGAAAIVAITRAGKTAHLLAAMRPTARVLAVTPNPAIAASFALVWGVTPVVTEHRAIGAVRRQLVAAEPGDRRRGDCVRLSAFDARSREHQLRSRRARLRLAVLGVALERNQRHLPAARDDRVVSAPARRGLVAILPHVQAATRRVRTAGHFEYHRPDRFALRRHPVGVGHHELMAGPGLDDRAVKHAAERAEDVVAVRRRCPLDGVHPEGHGRRDRSLRLPPRPQRVSLEETIEDDGRGGRNHDVLFETLVRFGLGLGHVWFVSGAGAVRRSVQQDTARAVS